ncbi:MAG: hypothetical protein V3T70_11845, partial [Phycisphaerae bacterium]
MDLQTFFRDPKFIAVRLAASDVFGLLTRHVDLPSDCAALVFQDDGTRMVASPGSTIESRGVRDLVAIRTAPIRLAFEERGLESSDGHECTAVLRVAIS